MSITERANGVRKRIPFAYWIVYDLVSLPVLAWAVTQHAWAIPAAGMWVVAAFFDINEALVKWQRRRSASGFSTITPRFLDVLARTGSRVMAAAAVDLTVAEVTYHRDRDPVFEREWRAAEGRARHMLKLRKAGRPVGTRRAPANPYW